METTGGELGIVITLVFFAIAGVGWFAGRDRERQKLAPFLRGVYRCATEREMGCCVQHGAVAADLLGLWGMELRGPEHYPARSGPRVGPPAAVLVLALLLPASAVAQNPTPRNEVARVSGAVAVSGARAEHGPTSGEVKKRSVFRSKQFWIDTGIVLLSAWADAKTTVISIRRCPYPHCEESNPLYGRNPSAGRVYGTALGLAGARRVIVALVWRRKEKVGRALSFADSLGSAVAHGTAAAGNASLPRVCPAAATGCGEGRR